MDFLKKHYEKIILALVLLSLTAAVGALLIYIPGEQKDLENQREVNIQKNPPALPPLDTKVFDEALKRAETPYKIDLTTKHRVVNPVLWQLHANGRLTKVESMDKIGLGALKLVNIEPLYLTITYVTNRVNGYEIEFRDDSAARPTPRRAVVHPDTVADVFLLRKVEGQADSPTALVLEFKNPAHEQFTLKANPDEPFKKVVAYSADLRYSPPQGAPLAWNKMRAAGGPGIPAALSTLNLDGTLYKVIDVDSNSVVISEPNNKRHTFPLSRPSE